MKRTRDDASLLVWSAIMKARLLCRICSQANKPFAAVFDAVDVAIPLGDFEESVDSVDGCMGPVDVIQFLPLLQSTIESIPWAEKILPEVCGLLPKIEKRLDANERAALRPGDVYVWEEKGPNTDSFSVSMERFTEGKSWTASRVREVRPSLQSLPLSTLSHVITFPRTSSCILRARGRARGTRGASPLSRSIGVNRDASSLSATRTSGLPRTRSSARASRTSTLS